MTGKPTSFSSPPQGYADWLTGHDILARQAEQGWGAKVIERLAHDLRTAFPQMKGFSRANLMYMRAFAEAWPDAAIVQQAVGQLPWGHNPHSIEQIERELGGQ